MSKRFGPELDNPKKQAEDALAAWKTDRNRGELRFQKEAITKFGILADKYWTDHASIEGRHPERSTFYTVQLTKQWLGETRKVGPLSAEELKTFQNDMRLLQRKLVAGGLTGATVNRYFNILRSIFERGRESGLIMVNPLEFVGRVQEDEPPVRFLEQEEIDRLFKAAENLHGSDGPIDHARITRLMDFMTVISHTGARPSSIEACSWDQGDVDLTHRIIWFVTYKGGRKRKKHRYPVPIDDTLFDLLTRRAEVTKRRGFVFDCTSIRELEVMAIEQSKVNEGKPENMHFTMYGLKHCFASHLLMTGASIDEVGDLLGHTDGRMVRKHYRHLTLDHLRKVQNRINLTPAQLKVI